MIGGDEWGSWKIPELLMRFIRASHELNRCEPAHGEGLTTQQIRALLYLIRHEGSTVKELATALSLSEARASRLADELAGSGNVFHTRDAHDRRVVRLQVTPAASARARGIYDERATALRVALTGASERELEIFTDLLQRVVEEFEALPLRSGAPHSGELTKSPALRLKEAPYHA